MSDKKTADEPVDSGLEIELTDDSTQKKQAKPFDQWTVEDFLAAGVNVTRSDAKHRVTNTATGVPGLKRTGILLVRGKNEPWKFAK
jgi:hypothetical protein